MSYILTHETTQTERDHMGPHNWKLCPDTFEWVHIPSGLSMYDIWSFVKFPL